MFQFYCVNFQGLIQYFAWRLQWKIPFISTVHYIWQFDLDFKEFKELFGSFFIFLTQRRKIGGKPQAKTQAKLLPSQACEPELRPSDPSNSAAVQPSPAVT